MPDGTLYDRFDGREYSYLFWEGTCPGAYDLSKGFVVKGEDTKDFLQEKLAFLGLTPREYNEFIVYWMPLMQDHPYNLISFQQEAYTDLARHGYLAGAGQHIAGLYGLSAAGRTDRNGTAAVGALHPHRFYCCGMGWRPDKRLTKIISKQHRLTQNPREENLCGGFAFTAQSCASNCLWKMVERRLEQKA